MRKLNYAILIYALIFGLTCSLQAQEFTDEKDIKKEKFKEGVREFDFCDIFTVNDDYREHDGPFSIDWDFAVSDIMRLAPDVWQRNLYQHFVAQYIGYRQWASYTTSHQLACDDTLKSSYLAYALDGLTSNFDSYNPFPNGVCSLLSNDKPHLHKIGDFYAKGICQNGDYVTPHTSTTNQLDFILLQVKCCRLPR